VEDAAAIVIGEDDFASCEPVKGESQPSRCTKLPTVERVFDLGGVRSYDLWVRTDGSWTQPWQSNRMGHNVALPHLSTRLARAASVARGGTSCRGHGTDTTIFPLAWLASMTRCASTISSKRKTRVGFAW
jgi:hypothetical protein